MRKSRIFFAVLALGGSLAVAQIRQVAILDVPGQPGFDSSAFCNGHLLLTHRTEGTLEIFDAAKRRLIARVEGLKEPRGLAVDLENARVFVANSGDRSIAVISAQDWKLDRSVSLPHTPDTLLYAPELGALYVGNWQNQSVTVVKLNEGKTADIPLEGRPEHFAFDHQQKLVFVSVQDRNEIAVLDATDRILRRFRLAASQPTGLGFDAAARRLFAAVRHAVLVLNADTGAELARVAAPAGIHTLHYDPSSRSLYAISAGGTLAVIAEQNGRLVSQQEFRTEVRGYTLAFDPERRLVYVPGGREGRAKLLILKHTPGRTAEQEALAAEKR
jgi:6-phosphogluconolactonase (cycloisomerase 2 family)